MPPRTTSPPVARASCTRLPRPTEPWPAAWRETRSWSARETLSKIINWHDRSTCVLFGDGAGAVVIGRVPDGGFLGFELGSDGEGGKELSMPGGGSRNPSSAETVAQEMHFLQMNGREVYKFATRVLVSSAEKLLDEIGLGVDDIDLYVPHQANKRIIDHAASKLGIPEEKVFVNVDRYGNTSSASIPLCLAQGVSEGRLKERDARADDRHGRRPHVGVGLHRLG